MTSDTSYNTRLLDEIESQLTDDVLTDDELVDWLAKAGLPEVARVITRTHRQLAKVDPFTADFLRELAGNARTRMNDGGDAAGGEQRAAYDRGWRDALDAMARSLERKADQIDPSQQARPENSSPSTVDWNPATAEEAQAMLHELERVVRARKAAGRPLADVPVAILVNEDHLVLAEAKPDQANTTTASELLQRIAKAMRAVPGC